MRVPRLTLLVAAIFGMVACGLPGRDTILSGGGSNVSEVEEPDLQNQIESEIITRDENGKVENVDGLDFSAEIKNSKDLSNDEKIKDLYNSEQSAFDFTPPEGFDAEFSEPVMISGGSLFLDNSNLLVTSCNGLSYNKEKPQIKDLFVSASENGVCGEMSIQYCIKLSPSDNTGLQKEAYIQTPAFLFQIPCSYSTFADFSIDIVEDNLSVNSEQASIS